MASVWGVCGLLKAADKFLLLQLRDSRVATCKSWYALLLEAASWLRVMFWTRSGTPRKSEAGSAVRRGKGILGWEGPDTAAPAAYI
ncbi:MAG: hypothetical protein BJ554DRAFT_3126 [Olpidium bornovanus]|uniref:Uncharacterized protein n=1 Tax=Olpidium bornovanus TaxID=278681 RepID=A0A8H7ZPX6_9FUNG|nr:MAG: hypothetical protein BJ554DRAFT_3126 [Olpidium bornovanus]